MLQAYFERTEKDKSYLFDGLKITSAGERHAHILELGVLVEDEVRDYRQILGGKEDEDMRINSIWFLSMCLEKAYGEKAIILIDEYDVPLENAYFVDSMVR